VALTSLVVWYALTWPRQPVVRRRGGRPSQSLEWTRGPRGSTTQRKRCGDSRRVARGARAKRSHHVVRRESQ